MHTKHRRAISIPVVIAIAIVLFFSGRYAWLKYRLIQWTKQTEKNIHLARKTIAEALKGSSYPVFMRAGTVIPARSPERGITIRAKMVEDGDKAVGSLLAAERQRDIATFYSCKPLDDGPCIVTFNRLYLDTGTPFGKRDQCIAALYLEKRTARITMPELASLDERLETTSEIEHVKLVRSVARVRVSVPRRQLNSRAPHVTFEILCLQPEIPEARQQVTETVEVQVHMRFQRAPKRL